MTMRESTNASGVRSIYDDGRGPTDADMAARAELSRKLRQAVSGLMPTRRGETDISNGYDLRERLKEAQCEMAQATANSARADRARDHAKALLDQAAREVQETASGLSQGGADLAERIAAWAEHGAPQPAFTSSAEDLAARQRHGTALAAESNARLALDTLTEAAEAPRKRMVAAGQALNRAVYAVVARDAEEIARRAAALREEAESLERGAFAFAAHFGPQSSVGHVPHTLTGGARLYPVGAGGNVVTRPFGQSDAIQDAWAAYVLALHSDPHATLELPPAA